MSIKIQDRLIITTKKNKKILVADSDLQESGNWHDVQEFINEEHDNWRLPSIDELELMYEQLHLKGKGKFKQGQYWSGTEESPHHVFYINFKDGLFSDALKIMGANARLVKGAE